MCGTASRRFLQFSHVSPLDASRKLTAAQEDGDRIHAAAGLRKKHWRCSSRQLRRAVNRRKALLLADIAVGEVNCVVVYKVDRLTRSLLDFSRIMDVLERHGATFVAVTQQVQYHLLARPPHPEYLSCPSPSSNVN